jgi:magnesium transporter
LSSIHSQKRSKKIGLPPGSMVFIGEKKLETTSLQIINYGEEHFQEKEANTIEECLQFKDLPTTTWFNVKGLNKTDEIGKLGRYFNLHPLLLEDIVNTDQRPKLDDYGDYLFIVFKMLHYKEQESIIKSEQISLILGNNFVISFQEGAEDIFIPIRDRIRNDKGIARKMGADYLAYALMDTVVDNYFTILEKFGDNIEFLEEEVVENPETETLQMIHSLKRELIFLRKSIWPLRDVVSRMERGGSKLIRNNTAIYLRDVYDHTIQVIDSIETYRDILSGILDIYFSSISNKMNEIMKVLTIIGTIFIPLTFLTGIYGMNFTYMPELSFTYGYPIVLLLMLIIVGIMVFYFRRKKWL